jgi:hypothetical protein
VLVLDVEELLVEVHSSQLPRLEDFLVLAI